MVTATKNPRVVRVQFGRDINALSRQEVVCYLRIKDTGVKIYYSHHLIFARPVPKGIWDRPQAVKKDLTHTLKAELFSEVYRELFDVLNGEGIDIAPFPDGGQVTDQPEAVQFED